MGTRLNRLTQVEQKKRDDIILRLKGKGYSVQEIANHLGKSRSVVYNRLKVLVAKREASDQ